MYSSLRLQTARSSRYPEFGGRPLLGGGGINVQYEGQKPPMPELASAIGGRPLSGVPLYT